MRHLNKIQLLFLILAVSACGITYKSDALFRKSKVSTSSFEVKIPYENKARLIIIPVTINGKTYRMLFDTGATISVVSREVAEELGLKKRSSTKVTDSRNTKRKTERTLIKELSIGTVSFENITAVIIDWPENSSIECITGDGIIGNNLIRHCNWVVDYQNKTLTATDKELKLDGISYTNMKYGDKRPYLQLELDSFTIDNVLLDLGSSGSLDLSLREYEKYPSIKKNYKHFHLLENLSQGMFGNKLDTSTEFFTDSLYLAGEALYRPNVEIEKKKGSKIGNKILSNYQMYLDYTNERIGFKPYPNQSTPVGFFNMIPNMAPNGQLYVGGILLEGQAYDHGIQFGDTISSINGVADPFYNTSYCDFFDYLLSEYKNLDSLSFTLKKEPHKTYHLPLAH